MSSAILQGIIPECQGACMNVSAQNQVDFINITLELYDVTQSVTVTLT